MGAQQSTSAAFDDNRLSRVLKFQGSAKKVRMGRDHFLSFLPSFLLWPSPPLRLVSFPSCFLFFVPFFFFFFF
jgi:hypothetical protein